MLFSAAIMTAVVVACFKISAVSYVLIVVILDHGRRERESYAVFEGMYAALMYVCTFRVRSRECVYDEWRA